jgi:hypothetical protein
MKLIDLEPEFLKLASLTEEKGFQRQETIEGADGIWFVCPACFEKNRGCVGSHHIICWRPHVPQTQTPTPGRWEFVGTKFEDLTLKAGSSSILLKGGCNAHFFIENGNIRMC